MAIIVIFVACSAWASDAPNSDIDILFGRWNSIEIGGKDSTDLIKTMSFEFNPDGTVRIDGDLKEEESEEIPLGTYKASKDSITIDMGDIVGSKTMHYSIGTNLILTLKQPHRDAWIRLEKDHAEQAGSGYPPQGVGSPDP